MMSHGQSQLERNQGKVLHVHPNHIYNITILPTTLAYPGIHLIGTLK